eukprot:284816577_3
MWDMAGDYGPRGDFPGASSRTLSCSIRPSTLRFRRLGCFLIQLALDFYLRGLCLWGTNAEKILFIQQSVCCNESCRGPGHSLSIRRNRVHNTGRMVRSVRFNHEGNAPAICLPCDSRAQIIAKSFFVLPSTLILSKAEDWHGGIWETGFPAFGDVIISFWRNSRRIEWRTSCSPRNQRRRDFAPPREVDACCDCLGRQDVRVWGARQPVTSRRPMDVFPSFPNLGERQGKDPAETVHTHLVSRHVDGLTIWNGSLLTCGCRHSLRCFPRHISGGQSMSYWARPGSCLPLSLSTSQRVLLMLYARPAQWSKSFFVVESLLNSAGLFLRLLSLTVTIAASGDLSAAGHGAGCLYLVIAGLSTAETTTTLKGGGTHRSPCQYTANLTLEKVWGMMRPGFTNEETNMHWLKVQQFSALLLEIMLVACCSAAHSRQELHLRGAYVRRQLTAWSTKSSSTWLQSIPSLSRIQMRMSRNKAAPTWKAPASLSRLRLHCVLSKFFSSEVNEYTALQKLPLRSEMQDCLKYMELPALYHFPISAIVCLEGAKTVPWHICITHLPEPRPRAYVADLPGGRRTKQMEQRIFGLGAFDKDSSRRRTNKPLATFRTKRRGRRRLLGQQMRFQAGLYLNADHMVRRFSYRSGVDSTSQCTSLSPNVDTSQSKQMQTFTQQRIPARAARENCRGSPRCCRSLPANCRAVWQLPMSRRKWHWRGIRCLDATQLSWSSRSGGRRKRFVNLMNLVPRGPRPYRHRLTYGTLIQRLWGRPRRQEVRHNSSVPSRRRPRRKLTGSHYVECQAGYGKLSGEAATTTLIRKIPPIIPLLEAVKGLKLSTSRRLLKKSLSCSSLSPPGLLQIWWSRYCGAHHFSVTCMVRLEDAVIDKAVDANVVPGRKYCSIMSYLRPVIMWPFFSKLFFSSGLHWTPRTAAVQSASIRLDSPRTKNYGKPKKAPSKAIVLTPAMVNPDLTRMQGNCSNVKSQVQDFVLTATLQKRFSGRRSFIFTKQLLVFQLYRSRILSRRARTAKDSVKIVAIVPSAFKHIHYPCGRGKIVARDALRMHDICLKTTPIPVRVARFLGNFCRPLGQYIVHIYVYHTAHKWSQVRVRSGFTIAGVNTIALLGAFLGLPFLVLGESSRIDALWTAAVLGVQCRPLEKNNLEKKGHIITGYLKYDMMEQYFLP